MDVITGLDHRLSLHFIDLLRSSPALEIFIQHVMKAAEFKGVVSAMIFWLLWFRAPQGRGEDRSLLCALLFVTVFCIGLGRTLANFLPFRMRPIVNPELVGDTLPEEYLLETWSSMPSDHAIMFFALATGFYLISRAWGMLAYGHAAFVVCLPRLMTGTHYLSDILVGALIGSLVAALLAPPVAQVVRARLERRDLPDHLVYPTLFLMTYAFATMFDGIRDLGRVSKSLIDTLL